MADRVGIVVSKLQISLLVIGAFVVGGVTSGYVVYKEQSNNFARQIAQIKKDANTSAIANAERQPTPAKKTGHGMTPDQMADELLLVPEGREFDWRYLNYLQVFRLNETAMSRIAAQKATKPELKAAAVEQMRLSDELSTQLFQWRTLWGFTDH